MKRFSNLVNNGINEHKKDNSKSNDEKIKVKPNGFCILKPGFIKYQKPFIDILKENNWIVLNKKKCVLTPDQASTLYVNLSEEPFYNDLCDYMSSDDCLCCSVYKNPKLCKDSDPICDMKNLKDSVRKTWGKTDMENAMHSSDSLDNVSRETLICFNDNIKDNLNEDDYPIHIPEEPTVSPRATELRIQAQITKDRLSINQFNSTESNYNIDLYKDIILDKLECAIAEEFEAGYFYLLTYNFVTGYDRVNIQNKFKEWSKEEIHEHANLLLSRINELGFNGVGSLVDFNNINNKCKRNGHSWKFNGSMNSIDLIQTAIDFECSSIETYKALECFTRNIDPVTNDLVKHLLADEIKHLTELTEFQNAAVQTTYDRL